MLVNDLASFGDVATLSALSLDAESISPNVRFPSEVVSLQLKVRAEPFDVSRLTQMTRLQVLDFRADWNPTPLDLSGLPL